MGNGVRCLEEIVDRATRLDNCMLQVAMVVQSELPSQWPLKLDQLQTNPARLS